MIVKKSFDEHLNVHTNTFKNLDEKINEASKIISDCLQNGGLVMWCGNGGSATDSMHLAAELVGRFKNNRKPLRSISLAADSAVITCISNDYGYENVFSRQIEGIAKKGDLLVSLSTSGKSKNILKAIEIAKSLKLKTISMLGKSGGDCAGKSDLDLIVPSDSTARIQEMHILIGHSLCELVEKNLKL